MRHGLGGMVMSFVWALVPLACGSGLDPTNLQVVEVPEMGLRVHLPHPVTESRWWDGTRTFQGQDAERRLTLLLREHSEPMVPHDLIDRGDSAPNSSTRPISHCGLDGGIITERFLFLLSSKRFVLLDEGRSLDLRIHARRSSLSRRLPLNPVRRGERVLLESVECMAD